MGSVGGQFTLGSNTDGQGESHDSSHSTPDGPGAVDGGLQRPCSGPRELRFGADSAGAPSGGVTAGCRRTAVAGQQRPAATGGCCFAEIRLAGRMRCAAKSGGGLAGLRTTGNAPPAAFEASCRPQYVRRLCGLFDRHPHNPALAGGCASCPAGSSAASWHTAFETNSLLSDARLARTHHTPNATHACADPVDRACGSRSRVESGAEV